MFVIRQQNMGTQLVFKWLGHWSRGVFYQEACWGGDYCGEDFGSVEDCYGCMAAGNLFRGACLRGVCRGQLPGTFVRRVGLGPSCQCCICLLIAILP